MWSIFLVPVPSQGVSVYRWLWLWDFGIYFSAGIWGKPPNSHGLGFLNLGNLGRFLYINIFHGGLMGTVNYCRTWIKKYYIIIIQFATYVIGVQRRRVNFPPNLKTKDFKSGAPLKWSHLRWLCWKASGWIFFWNFGSSSVELPFGKRKVTI